MPLALPPATIRNQLSVPLRFADGYTTSARVFSFDGLVDGQEHLAFGLGDRAAPLTSVGHGRAPLVRPHSECLTGDVFGSQRCDCGAQLREAVERIVTAQVPTGVHLSAANARYLATKAGIGAHTLDVALSAG